MLIKLLVSVWLFILLTACSSAPAAKTEIVKIKPDPTWMADCAVPVRNGPTLGDYYDWSFELWTALRECNERQRAEREFYDGKNTRQKD